MPQIGVIVPVYKVEPYLRRCVDSILAQTFTDFELILVDDGSPDSCPAICDEYAQKDSRVRVIHQYNQGQSAARNNAVAHSLGKWICFVDSDDVLHPQTLEFLYRAVKDTNAKISMCNPIEADQLPEDFLRSQSYYNSVMSVNESNLMELYRDERKYYWVVWAKLIERDIIVNYPFAYGRIYEDNATVFKWLISAHSIAIVDLPLYFYQVNPQGTTKSSFNIRRLDYLWALGQQLEYYKESHMHDMGKMVFSDYTNISQKYYSIVLNDCNDKKSSKRIKRQFGKYYRKTKRWVEIPQTLKLSALQFLYPRSMSVYWMLRNGIDIVKKQGMVALIKKIVEKAKKK